MRVLERHGVEWDGGVYGKNKCGKSCVNIFYGRVRGGGEDG